MDVTFLENVPFYTKTHIPGENPVNQQVEYQFWDVPVPDFGVPEPNFSSEPSMAPDGPPSESRQIQGDKEINILKINFPITHLHSTYNTQT